LLVMHACTKIMQRIYACAIRSVSSAKEENFKENLRKRAYRVLTMELRDDESYDTHGAQHPYAPSTVNDLDFVWVLQTLVQTEPNTLQDVVPARGRNDAQELRDLRTGEGRVVCRRAGLDISVRVFHA
jgi:hypothetical protein